MTRDGKSGKAKRKRNGVKGVLVKVLRKKERVKGKRGEERRRL